MLCMYTRFRKQVENKKNLKSQSVISTQRDDRRDDFYTRTGQPQDNSSWGSLKLDLRLEKIRTLLHEASFFELIEKVRFENSLNIKGTVESDDESVIVWQCFSYNEAGKLAIIYDTLKSEQSLNVLNKN